MTLPQRLSLACLAGYSALSIAAPRSNLFTCQTSATFAESQDITGTILIKKKLTKRSVTASVSIYQRGTAVELGKDAEEDPLEFERSHVVIYLEGPSGISPAKTTVLTMQQVHRRFSPDLLVIHGRFRPNTGQSEIPFVQMRVKQGPEWLIRELWLFLSPG